MVAGDEQLSVGEVGKQAKAVAEGLEVASGRVTHQDETIPTRRQRLPGQLLGRLARTANVVMQVSGNKDPHDGRRL